MLALSKLYVNMMILHFDIIHLTYRGNHMQGHHVIDNNFLNEICSLPFFKKHVLLKYQQHYSLSLFS